MDSFCREELLLALVVAVRKVENLISVEGPDKSGELEKVSKFD